MQSKREVASNLKINPRWIVEGSGLIHDTSWNDPRRSSPVPSNFRGFRDGLPGCSSLTWVEPIRNPLMRRRPFQATTLLALVKDPAAVRAQAERGLATVHRRQREAMDRLRASLS